MFGLLNECEENLFLQSVSVQCKIKNLLVSCYSEFIYKNDSDEDTEGLFTFPLDGSCVIYDFSVEIGGKIIFGICKEIEEAKNMYNVAKEAGYKGALILRNRSMMDVFNCCIGNIPSRSVAKITLKFAMELNLNLNKSNCVDVDRFNLCLPLILRPRYTPQDYVGDDDVYYVNNKYDYKFQAIISGTKEIKDIFSNNYHLKWNIKSGNKNGAEVFLESLYDGIHDLDINIDYLKIKSPAVFYEYGTLSNKFNGIRMDGAFYKADVAMLHFLPEFKEKKGVKNKIEVVFVVDRSGSMGGSNIQHAKECLLIFLKSLPMNTIFQIYGFGYNFDKVFPQPQLYNEQSIELAINYQKRIEADFGGTELMNPLKDIYNSSLTNDCTRIVFLLTDGDVGNQDEVFKLVRQHNHSTRLFTVGIGDGVSTSLVQKVAESGLGKSVFVRDSKTLSASVIELLDIALNCDQFTDCKIEWQCPNNASIVMVPSNPGPIFSNYFLTFFCMIEGLQEDESIQCNLSGKVNGQSMNLSLDISCKNGTSDDEFRVHRLLAKYKIDELTRKIEDGRNDLKKSLIELSLEVNMVTTFTTFVAIDKDAPEKGLLVEEDEDSDQYCLMSCNVAYDTMDAMSSNVAYYRMDAMSCNVAYDTMDAMSCNVAYDTMDAMKIYEGGYEDESSEEEMKLSGNDNESSHEWKEKECCSNKINENDKNIVLYLAEKQGINGSWKFDENIIRKLDLDLIKLRMEKPDSINDDTWITVIIYNYLVNKMLSKEKEWRLFARKALEAIEKIICDTFTFEEIMKKGLEMI